MELTNKKFICKNGYLDLEKKEFIPSEGQYSKESEGCGINYQVFNKNDPQYIKLMDILRKIYPNNINEVLKMWAKCLKGGNGGKVFVHLGSGYNGKTTMLRLVDNTFGSYCFKIRKEQDALYIENSNDISYNKKVRDIRIVRLYEEIKHPINTEFFDFEKYSFHIESNTIETNPKKYKIINYETTFITEKSLLLEDSTSQLKNINIYNDIQQYAEVFLFLLFEIYKDI